MMSTPPPFPPPQAGEGRVAIGEFRWRPPGSSARCCGGRSRSGACRPPPSRGQALEPVNRLAVALAGRIVHRGEQVGRPRQLELDEGHPGSGMRLEDAGEDQIAHRQRRIERLRRAAAGVAQRSGTRPADPALPSRRRVQAQWQVERLGGGPERLVFGLVVAPSSSGYSVIIAPERPRRAARSGSLIPSWTSSRLIIAMPFNRAGSVLQKSASESLYARKM